MTRYYVVVDDDGVNLQWDSSPWGDVASRWVLNGKWLCGKEQAELLADRFRYASEIVQYAKNPTS